MSAVLEKTVRDVAEVTGQPVDVIIGVVLRAGLCTEEQAAELLQECSA